MGLMQLMPSTARVYNVRNPFDPKANIEAGIKHLKSLIDRFGTEALALAAYNAGEGAVTKFNGIPPYRETRNYVARILSLAGSSSPAGRRALRNRRRPHFPPRESEIPAEAVRDCLRCGRTRVSAPESLVYNPAEASSR